MQRRCMKVVGADFSVFLHNPINNDRRRKLIFCFEDTDCNLVFLWNAIDRVGIGTVPLRSEAQTDPIEPARQYFTLKPTPFRVSGAQTDVDLTVFGVLEL
jgi:hypothetical protein